MSLSKSAIRLPRVEVPDWDTMVVVGRVARAHGLRGQVIVNPETDFLDQRFRVGAGLFALHSGVARPLTVTAVRFHEGRPILTFEGVSTIEDVEWLINAELRIPATELHTLPVDQFYRHDLVGCHVRTAAGLDVGTVIAVEGPREGSHLVVSREGREVLVPLAADICIEIDPRGRRILIEPPEGLLDLNDT